MAMTSSGSAVVTLPTDTEILITREFDAPKHLVYRAYTEPDLVSRWWPGKRGEMTLCEIDLRVGGSYRYVMNATGGFEVGFHGTTRRSSRTSGSSTPRCSRASRTATTTRR